MQQIFIDHKFTIDNNVIGVDTTTIVAPEGLKFFHYNPRDCNTVAEIFNATRTQVKEHPGGRDKMTVAGYYSLENWPFVLIYPQVMADLEKHCRLFAEAHAKLAELDAAGKNLLYQLK